MTLLDRDCHVDKERKSRGGHTWLKSMIKECNLIYLACMGSLGLPVQTKVLTGTEESQTASHSSSRFSSSWTEVSEATLRNTVLFRPEKTREKVS